MFIALFTNGSHSVQKEKNLKSDVLWFPKAPLFSQPLNHGQSKKDFLLEVI